jgi:hypothetical protein
VVVREHHERPADEPGGLAVADLLGDPGEGEAELPEPFQRAHTGTARGSRFPVGVLLGVVRIP